MITYIDQNLLARNKSEDYDYLFDLIDHKKISSNFTMPFSGILEFLGITFEASKVLNKIDSSLPISIPLISEILLNSDQYLYITVNNQKKSFNVSEMTNYGILRAQQEIKYATANYSKTVSGLKIEAYQSIINSLMTQSPEYQAGVLSTKVIQSNRFANSILNKHNQKEFYLESISMAINLDVPVTRVAIRHLKNLNIETTHIDLDVDKEYYEEEALWHLCAGRLEKDKSRNSPVKFITAESRLLPRLENLLECLALSAEAGNDKLLNILKENKGSTLYIVNRRNNCIREENMDGRIIEALARAKKYVRHMKQSC